MNIEDDFECTPLLLSCFHANEEMLEVGNKHNSNLIHIGLTLGVTNLKFIIDILEMFKCYMTVKQIGTREQTDGMAEIFEKL